eukprot:COSAG05_NODE_2195_length_3413_cov_24.923959_3_plen_426_part_00
MDSSDGDHSKLTFAGLFGIAFFWVCGGPYGNEALVQQGPSGVVFLVYAASTVLYSIPIALINAELAVAIPEDGGLVVWVNKAFGPIVGGYSAWFWLCSVMFDSAIYPTLAAEYILTGGNIAKDEEDLNRFTVILIAEAVVLGSTCVKLLGSDIVSKFSTLATLVSLVPVVVLLAWSIFTVRMRPARWFRWSSIALEPEPEPEPDWEADVLSAAELQIQAGTGGQAFALTQVDPADELTFDGVNWGLLISWCIWLSSGYLGLGSLAAGIDNPTRTYPLLLSILIPFVMCVYIFPFFVSLSITEDMRLYEAGFFVSIATQVAGEWLSSLMLFSACTAMAALYISVSIMSEVSMQAMLEEHSPTVRRYANLDGNLFKETRGCKGFCSGPPIRRWLFFHQDGSPAPAYILTNAAVATVLVTFPYREFSS